MDVLQSTPVSVPQTGLDPQLLAAQARGGKDAKQIDKAAEGFESVFDSMLIKQMRQALPENSLFGKDAGDVMGGLFDFYMGQHLAQAGGLGIGKMIKQQLTAAEARHHEPSTQQHAAGPNAAARSVPAPAPTGRSVPH